MIAIAQQLLEAGYAPVPLFAGKKHLDIVAAGRTPFHLQVRSKHLKNLVFASLLTELASHPPGAEELRAWFADPKANIGVAGGVGGLAILDIDDKRAFETLLTRFPGIVANAPAASTPSGFHVYLRLARPAISSSLHFGFRRIGHVKALGGYVVCPPSILANGGGYEWLPGRSVFECRPVEIDALEVLGLSAKSPVRNWYDRTFSRGGFVDR